MNLNEDCFNAFILPMEVDVHDVGPIALMQFYLQLHLLTLFFFCSAPLALLYIFFLRFLRNIDSAPQFTYCGLRSD